MRSPIHGKGRSTPATPAVSHRPIGPDAPSHRARLRRCGSFASSALLPVFALLTLDAATGAADPVIRPVSVTATSYWGPGIPHGKPGNLIDGSGRSGAGAVQGHTRHNSGNAATMWHSGDVDGGLGGPTGTPPPEDSQALVFDLGTTTSLTGAWIWNHNQSLLSHRGVNQFNILVSSGS